MKLAAVLERLVSEVGSVVDGLDVETLCGSDAAELVSLFSVLERRAGAGKLVCARRAVNVDAHLSSGSRDGASWFARISGNSVGAAKSLLETASQVESLPEVKSAFYSGELSVEQTQLICNTAGSDPGLGAQLVDVAKESSLVGLKRSCRKVGSPSSESENDRFEKLRSKRYFRTWSDSDGMVCGSFRLMPEDGALLLARMKPFVDQAFADGRQRGARESYGAYSADGFVGLVETSGGDKKPTRAEVIVIADYEALVRGHVEFGETCEIEGIGPVPVSLVRSLMDDCYLSQIVKCNGKPSIVRGKGRYIPDRLRKAVKIRDRCCVVPGCDSLFRLEIDHIIAVCDGGETTIDNLVLLCKAHHDHKTYRGFGLVDDVWVGPREVVLVA